MAVNLTGTAVDEDLARGDVLARAATGVRPSYRVDAELEFGPTREPEHGDRVQIHHGTREAPGAPRLARRALLAAPPRAAARPGGGGPRSWCGRSRRRTRSGEGGCSIPPAPARPEPRDAGPARAAGPRAKRRNRPDGLAGPDARRESGPGTRREARPSRTPARPTIEPLSDSALALERRLRDAGVEPPLDSELDAADLAALRDAGRAVRVSKNLHYHAEVLRDIRTRLVALAERHGGAVTLAQLRDELGTSRKFAQALLEHSTPSG